MYDLKATLNFIYFIYFTVPGVEPRIQYILLESALNRATALSLTF